MRAAQAVLIPVLALLMAAPTVAAESRPFRLEGLDSGSLGPSDFGEGSVIVVVWASWSPHSRNVVQRVNAIADRWGGRARVIMVDFQEERSEVEDFLRGKAPKAPVYLDESGSFSKQYSVTNLPGLVVFKEGEAVFSGRLPRDPDTVLSRALE